MVSQGAEVAIQLTSTIVMARLLGPKEYGVVAMVSAVTAFAGLFRDLGLSSSTIQRDKLSQDQLSAVFWINVGAGAVLTVLISASAPLVAWFYGRPELAAVTLVLSLKFIASSLGTQHSALLTRQMRFGRKAVAKLSGSLVTVVVSVGMAIQGFSYWSVVIGGLAGIVVTTLLLNCLSGWKPRWIVRGAGVRSMLKFGATITAFDFVNYFSRNSDNILIGRFWGADALGIYSRAYQLLMFPITNLRAPITVVAFPAMSRLQGQPDHFRGYYCRVTSTLAFLSMPLAAYLFGTSDSVIAIALGARWSEVSPIFSTLALTSFIQPCASLIGLVCLSLGMGKRYLHLGICGAVVSVTGFVIGVYWGASGVAWAYAITTYLGLVPFTAWAFHKTPLRLSDFFQSVKYPAVASFLAGAVIWVLRSSSPTFGPWTVIAITAPLFAIIYLAAFLLLPGGKSEANKMIEMVRSIMKRR